MKWLGLMLAAAAVSGAMGCSDDASGQYGDENQSQAPVMETVEQALWSACSTWSASSDCAADVTKFKDAHPCADWVSAPYCSSGVCKITAQFNLSCESNGGECSSDSQCSYMSAWSGYKVVCKDYYCQQQWIGGTSCDDGNACTYNDKWTSSGYCQGTQLNCGSGKYCSGGSCYYSSGSSCDDGDPCTWNDKYDSWGSCKGKTIDCGSGYYCSGGTCYYSGSTSCDDGNACTYNDKKDAWDYCSGTPVSCGSGYYCSGGSCLWGGGSSSGQSKCFNLYLTNLGDDFSQMVVGGIACEKYVENWDGSINFNNSVCGSWSDWWDSEPMTSLGYAGSMTLKVPAGKKYFYHIIKLDGIHYVDTSSGPSHWWKGSLSYKTTGGSSLSYWYVKGSGGGGLIATDLSWMSPNCN